MVIAELPLWVTHRETSSSKQHQAQVGKVQSSSQDTEQAGSNADSQLGRGVDIGKDEETKEAALASLALLQDHRNQCAIYSIDVHPFLPKFATAGGDGTVRIWSTETLFSSYHRGGRYDEKAGYISTSDDDDYDENGNSNNEEDNSSSEDGSRQRRNRSSNNANVDQGIVSNSENEDKEMNDEGDKRDGKEQHASDMDVDEDKSETSQEKSKHRQSAAINDLNQLVRRKSSSNSTIPRIQPPPLSTKANSRPPVAGNNEKKIFSSEREAHRLLCTLSAHTGSSVLCVRWSALGNFLASAGDDGCVCIYAPASKATIGNLVDVKNVEHWSRILLCRGHNLDVVGLAWAPDDTHLVSCSLDRETPILVWKTTDLARGNIPEAHHRMRHPYKTLGRDVHTSTVKGVTFDPAGSYLASSGDDPSVCIWRAHDDWGLEKRIDASQGIFRQWKEYDSISMSAQSLFRRISWATDGSYICSTNSVVKNKNVASTIARDGWAVATDKNRTAGAATLVGHKQPIVASRHASQWLDSSKTNDKADDKDEDEEPEYATLLALGDKSGFVTVWSTRKSKPVFKLQCSETRCTVTDLAWGKIGKAGHMMLFVSLLDGQVVVVRFHVPDELGPLLSDHGQAKVFQLRYGIDLQIEKGKDGTGGGAWQRTGMVVGEHSGPQLIENTIQMSLERQVMENDGRQKHEESDDNDEPMPDDNDDDDLNGSSTQDLRSRQVESQTRGGKKRVQPVLVSADSGETVKQARMAGTPVRKSNMASPDVVQDALAAADRAEAITGTKTAVNRPSPARTQQPQQPQQQHRQASPPLHHPSPGNNFQSPMSSAFVIPPSSERIHSIDLPGLSMLEATSGLSAACHNSRRTPIGTRTGGASIPCIDLSITRDGRVVWRDEIPGTVCTATCASSHLWAVGTMDGSVQMYGTSPSLGWECGQAFRIMAPLVLGSTVVEIQMQQDQSTTEGTTTNPMLIILSDGSFFVFNMAPKASLQYKGSILPAMNHVALSLPVESDERPTPTLSKTRMTKDGHLIILLSLQRSSKPRGSPTSTIGGRGVSNESPRRGLNNRVRNNINNQNMDHGVGGSVQAFQYNRAMQLWTRASDSRFVCSDYYQILPSSLSTKGKKLGPLSELDNSVRVGTLGSSLKPSGRPSSESALVLCSDPSRREEDDGRGAKAQENFIPTRSHCEDRIACALQLGSAREVRHWLLKYIKALIVGGHESSLRVVIHTIMSTGNKDSSIARGTMPFFLSLAFDLLEEDPISFVRSEVLRQMGKNRSLQRLTSEIQLEVNSLMND